MDNNQAFVATGWTGVSYRQAQGRCQRDSYARSHSMSWMLRRHLMARPPRRSLHLKGHEIPGRASRVKIIMGRWKQIMQRKIYFVWVEHKIFIPGRVSDEWGPRHLFPPTLTCIIDCDVLHCPGMHHRMRTKDIGRSKNDVLHCPGHFNQALYQRHLVNWKNIRDRSAT